MDKSQGWIEDRAATALTYLANTDEEDASLRMEMVKAERAFKCIIDAIFLHEKEGSIEHKKAKARVSSAADGGFAILSAASFEFNKVHNKRQSERDALEWCRSLNANRRQGQ